jgi:anaerobic ribonucleoside-triphosphate reductase activating protein
MLRFEPKQAIAVDDILSDALLAEVEGFSFLGGEPLSQARAFADLAEKAQRSGLTVMVFSGYTLGELSTMDDPDVGRLLASTDLLVDGRYEESLRTTERRWIGSTNQVMHFLSDAYAPDDPRFRAPNHVEIRLGGGRIVMNGWPVAGSRTKI